MAITTIYTYPLTGSQREFTVPFEYLARRFVVLTLIGQDRKELVLATDFRFISKTVVQTTVPWGPADGYERIEIRRDTSATDRLVDFADGSILRASELNISQIQTLHVAEEARNMVADTIAENADGDLDARGRRVANLGDPVDDYDAVNLKKAQALDAAVAATAATAATAAAKASEVAAKASEVAAKASETSAAADAALVLSHIASYGANPVGTIVMALKDSLPGHLLLNGSTFDQATYPELYAYLGTNVLPDWRNRYPKGAGVAVVGSVADGSFPAHTHTVPAHTHTGSVASAGAHTHTVSGTAESAGEHSHHSGLSAEGTASAYGNTTLGGRLGATTSSSTNYTRYPNTSTGGAHTHTVSGTAGSAGEHTHAVSIDAGGSGSTGSVGSGSTVETSRVHVNFFIKAKGLAQT